MSTIDFEDISYLQQGNERQKESFKVLTENCIFEYLIEFDPILVGTIPIGIDTPESDLDIICCFSDAGSFVRGISYCFENHDDFSVDQARADGSVVMRFSIDGFWIELYGCNVPTTQQKAYLHMLCEERLLRHYGENFRLAIVELKMKGIKTEPAFTMLLGLDGDPYEQLLSLDFSKIPSNFQLR